jgi:hypothetical protein
MEIASVISLGESQIMKDQKTDTLAMAIQNSPEEDKLDFESIRDTAKRAQKSLSPKVKDITQAELRSIALYLKDIARYVKRYASNGKMKFEYDCSKLTPVCFMELALQFKNKNPMFFVVTNSKTQVLTVDWSGKSEA